MREARHDDYKSDFQLGRLAGFSDGVISISITLLVIEIKVPEIMSYISDDLLFEYLRHTSFKFLGFLISFFIIGHYWSVHHRIFGYVKKSTTALIWINLIYLLSVGMLPFSSGLLGEFSTNLHMNIPYIIYVGNMV